MLKGEIRQYADELIIGEPFEETMRNASVRDS